MNRPSNQIPAALTALLLVASAACSDKKSSLTADLPDKFEGKTVELVSFADSTILNQAVVTHGKAVFDNAGIVADGPLLAQITVDGRVKGYAVIEPGGAVIADSAYVATGTPLNDRFAAMMRRMDSVEQTDDMFRYADLAEAGYNENKQNALGMYFGVEWIKFADPSRLDSMLKTAPENFVNAPRTQKAIAASRLRLATSPGHKYTDFSAPGRDGKTVSLSSLVKPGKYTVVDFWASWCPYCIKELPELKYIYEQYKDKGLEIVGVAVRDKVEDTEKAVAKHDIPWTVMYNAQRVPYGIYGFAGIPHHILIGPDGTIISRGESAAQLNARIVALLK